MDATYLAELASASRGFAAFADRREGEEWETNGRRYRRANGRTVRLGKKGGGGSPKQPPDFRVEGLPDAPAPPPAPPPAPAVPPETPDGLAPGVYHGPTRTLRQRIAGRLRKLALEWVPKIKSIPSMLPGVAGTVAAGAGGVAAGGPAGVMLGSVVAGGLLNKAMDRGAKRAKAARLAMARTPAERRWAAKRNQQVYFSEVGALTREMEAAFGDLSHRLRVHRFAWKQGKRGGRYWLPDGKEDRPANRLYGAKAESAAKSAGARGGEKAPRGGPRPGEEQRVARAKFEVARDAHAAAVQAKLPRDRIDWLRGRMEAAQKELEAKAPKQAGPAGVNPAGASRPGAGSRPAPAVNPPAATERPAGPAADIVKKELEALTRTEAANRERAALTMSTAERAGATRRADIEASRAEARRRALQHLTPGDWAELDAVVKAKGDLSDSDLRAVLERRGQLTRRPPASPPGGTPAERSAMDAMARAEVGTPAYEAAKSRYVRARRAAKAPPAAEGLNPFGWLSRQYGKLRERYGRTGAALTVAGMALPVPGTVVAAPLAAEAVLRARKFLGMSDRPAA